MRTFSALALTCVAVFTLTACGGNSDTTANSNSGTKQEQTQSSKNKSDGKKGEPIVAGDFTITVSEFNDNAQVPGVTATSPDWKLVLVKGTFTNNSKDRNVDLSCGADLDANIFDQNGNGYGWINNLASVPGNPKCGEVVTPGQTREMTWVSSRQPDFTPSWFGFMDSGKPGNLSKIRLR